MCCYVWGCESTTENWNGFFLLSSFLCSVYQRLWATNMKENTEIFLVLRDFLLRLFLRFVEHFPLFTRQHCFLHHREAENSFASRCNELSPSELKSLLHSPHELVNILCSLVQRVEKPPKRIFVFPSNIWLYFCSIHIAHSVEFRDVVELSSSIIAAEAAKMANAIEHFPQNFPPKISPCLKEYRWIILLVLFSDFQWNNSLYLIRCEGCGAVCSLHLFAFTFIIKILCWAQRHKTFSAFSPLYSGMYMCTILSS